jgi:hypothetical protein
MCAKILKNAFALMDDPTHAPQTSSFMSEVGGLARDA